MNLISIENLAKAYADRPLFHSLNFGVSFGQKIALVGKNGAGKSTLLKIMAGLVPADNGQVTVRKDTRIGYLPQVPQLDEAADVLNNIFAQDNQRAQAMLRYDKAVQQGDDLTDALEVMERLQAWDFEATAKQVLGKLGISQTDKLVGDLSGGQKKRVALAKLLLEEPDVILLDEPTNHLDIEAIEWLERFLVEQFKTIVLITHDRYFLEAITSEILELSQQKIFKHEGKYSDFLQNRMSRQQHAEVTKDKAQKLMKKELDWLRRQPKARGTKAKYRVDAFDGVKGKANEDISVKQMELNVGSTRQGKKVVELHDVSHAYDQQPVISHFTHKFARGERVGVVGKNGVGKSTFLNIVTGQLSPQQGKVVIGEITVFGYYTQESISLNPENRIIEEVREIAEYVKLADGSRLSVSKFLEQFLFDTNQQYTYIDKLSGGEKRRLQLLKVLVKQPNFLILDEPTNDFDIDTLNVLENYLDHFDGSLLVVSHDRYFLDRVCDRLFVFPGGGHIIDYPGNYSDFRQQEKAKSQVKNKSSKKTDDPGSTAVKNDYSKRLTYKEKRELANLEEEIAKLEQQKVAMAKQMSGGESDHEKLQKWGQELQEIEDAIEAKTMRWMELDEKQND